MENNVFSTMEAYKKAREVVLNSVISENKLITFQSEVSMDEFMEAVKVLMTFASMSSDTHVELYNCNIQCKRFKQKPCPGDCMVSDKSTKLCPYYMEDNEEDK